MEEQVATHNTPLPPSRGDVSSQRPDASVAKEDLGNKTSITSMKSIDYMEYTQFHTT